MGKVMLRVHAAHSTHRPTRSQTIKNHLRGAAESVAADDDVDDDDEDESVKNFATYIY